MLYLLVYVDVDTNKNKFVIIFTPKIISFLFNHSYNKSKIDPTKFGDKKKFHDR